MALATPRGESRSRCPRLKPSARPARCSDPPAASRTRCESHRPRHPVHRRRSPPRTFPRQEAQRHLHGPRIPVGNRPDVPVLAAAARHRDVLHRPAGEHAHLIPGGRNLLDELEVVLPRIVFGIVRHHLERALEHDVERQFMRPRVRGAIGSLLRATNFSRVALPKAPGV